MSVSPVDTIVFREPLISVGKHFRGDYGKSPQYISEVQGELRRSFARFVPNKVLGVYYDNPQVTPHAEQSSFQGVFLLQSESQSGLSLSTFSLQGEFLHVSVAGDPMQSVLEGYAALFGHIQQHETILKSPAGHQISTFENGVVTTDIYLELGG